MARRHRRLLTWLVLLAAAGAALYYYDAHRPTAGAGAQAGGACDESLWAHVYKPDRLQDPDPAVHHKCITVTGTVAKVVHEDDGDDHIRLMLDAPYAGLVSQGNTDRQAGGLVVEVICAHAVMQESAKAACPAYANAVPIPHVGDHVEVVGTYVFDAENSQHDWMEIHPATRITVLPS